MNENKEGNLAWPRTEELPAVLRAWVDCIHPTQGQALLRAAADEIESLRSRLSKESRMPEPYPGFDKIPTPRTDAVDIAENWDTPDKLADLCRELEREVTLADYTYLALCKKNAERDAYAGAFVALTRKNMEARLELACIDQHDEPARYQRALHEVATSDVELMKALDSHPQMNSSARLHHHDHQASRQDVEPGVGVAVRPSSADRSSRPDHGIGERTGTNRGTTAQDGGSADENHMKGSATRQPPTNPNPSGPADQRLATAAKNEAPLFATGGASGPAGLGPSEGAYVGPVWLCHNDENGNRRCEWSTPHFVAEKSSLQLVYEVPPACTEPDWETWNAALEMAAQLCEAEYADFGWNGHYKNAAANCAATIRLNKREAERPAVNNLSDQEKA